ncbi:MAG TPA: hypothetical protein VN822_06075 [Candidatus Acidoferrales bacterium]|nr:hypothetical protein [Candidatus Acidoferrales bacterium]
MIGRIWEWAKPKLAVCAIFALLIEAGGSWQAGHLMNADEWIAAEDAAVYGLADGLYWLATFGTGKKGEWR